MAVDTCMAACTEPRMAVSTRELPELPMAVDTGGHVLL